MIQPFSNYYYFSALDDYPNNYSENLSVLIKISKVSKLWNNHCLVNIIKLLNFIPTINDLKVVLVSQDCPLLISRVAKAASVTQPDKNELLEFAIRKRRTWSACALIQNGADINSIKSQLLDESMRGWIFEYTAFKTNPFRYIVSQLQNDDSFDSDLFGAALTIFSFVK